jgi:hypothetical protein
LRALFSVPFFRSSLGLSPGIVNTALARMFVVVMAARRTHVTPAILLQNTDQFPYLHTPKATLGSPRAPVARAPNHRRWRPDSVELAHGASSVGVHSIPFPAQRGRGKLTILRHRAWRVCLSLIEGYEHETRVIASPIRQDGGTGCGCGRHRRDFGGGAARVSGPVGGPGAGGERPASAGRARPG